MADTLETLEIEVKHSASGAADEITKVADAVSALSKALNGVPSKLKKLAEAMDAIKGVKKNLTLNLNDNHTTHIGDTYNQTQKAAASAGKATKEASKGISEMAKSAAKAKSPLDNFVSSLKRIAFYRIIRSIIKSITQAFQEGLQNAYTFSQGIATEGHRFAAALDSMSTAGLKMKNQLGSAFIALLTALAPIINAIIGLITRLADALSQLFAVFTGGTYLKAADMPKKWGEAAGGAAKAAKEWRNQLLGFDEINRLEEPNDPNGGGGGALDPSQMFEDTPIDGIFKKIRDKLIELKDSLNFEPLLFEWERLKKSVKELGAVIVSALSWAWDNILVPLAHWTIEEFAPTAVHLLATAFDFLRTVLEVLSPILLNLWEKILKPMFNFIGDVVLQTLWDLNDVLIDLGRVLKGEVSFKDFINGLTDSQTWVFALLSAIVLVSSAISIASTVMGVFNGVLAFFAANPAVLAIAAISAIIVIIIELYKHWGEITAAVERFRNTLVSALNDGKFGWIDFAAAALQVIYAPINALITLVNWIITAIRWLKSLDNMHISANVSSAIANDSYTSGNYYGYASGGHPSEGEIFVARESGPEMVGMMGGRTTVATNADIVEGIRQGVFEAVSAAMNGGQNDVNVRVYLDSREIKVGQNRLNRAMGVG